MMQNRHYQIINLELVFKKGISEAKANSKEGTHDSNNKQCYKRHCKQGLSNLLEACHLLPDFIFTLILACECTTYNTGNTVYQLPPSPKL